MKMIYEKPLVAVERYELTQAIAGCAANAKIGFYDSACVIADSNAPTQMKQFAELFSLFTAGAGNYAGCVYQVSTSTYKDTVEDGICYHTTANAAFNS